MDPKNPQLPLETARPLAWAMLSVLVALLVMGFFL